MEKGKSQPSGPPFQWETRRASFPTGTGGPSGVGIFLSPLDTHDGFYLSSINEYLSGTFKHDDRSSIILRLFDNDDRCLENLFETIKGSEDSFTDKAL